MKIYGDDSPVLRIKISYFYLSSPSWPRLRQLSNIITQIRSINQNKWR